MTYFERIAIERLKRNIEKYKLEHLFINNGNEIIINKSASSFLATFMLFCLILLPFYFLLEVLIFVKPIQIIAALGLLGATLGFGRSLYKIIKSENYLKLNFEKKCLQIQNNNYIFKKILPHKYIDFKDIIRCYLKNEEIYHRHSKTTKWIKVMITDINNKTYISSTFNNEYPETSIAHEVKCLIDSIISENKNNKKLLK
jgi:hypothetical protein